MSVETRRQSMWLSQSAANFIYNWANVFLIVGLVIGAVSTVLIVWSGNVKDVYLRLELSARASDAAYANLQITSLEIQGKKLEKETAEANERAEKARLELAQFKAPRRLSQSQMDQIAAVARKFVGQHFSGSVASSVPDAPFLWRQMDVSLRNGGWVRVDPPGLAVGTPPAGVPIQPRDGLTILVARDDRFRLLQTAEELRTAIADAGLQPTVEFDNGPLTQAGVLVIEIGTKPTQ